MNDFDPDLMQYEPRDRMEPSVSDKKQTNGGLDKIPDDCVAGDQTIQKASVKMTEIAPILHAMNAAAHKKYKKNYNNLTPNERNALHQSVKSGEFKKQEKSMNDVKTRFQKIVHECMTELKKESPRERLKESLRPMVQQVLGEIANIKVKEIDDEKAEKEKVQKGYDFARQSLYQKGGGTQRLDITNQEKKDELEKLVKDIDKSWDVYWDDHLELNVDAKNCGRIRISPKFENNFDIDFMVKLVDRIRAIALTWEQVKEFVKVNLKNLKGAEGNKTIADKKREQALANYVDDDKQKDAGPRWDVIKNRGEKNNGEDAKIKDTPKKNKDFNEKQVKKDEDQPNQPMKDVTKPGEDPEGKNKNIQKTPQVKPPKHDNDDTLKIKDKKTSKFRARKN